MGKHLIVGADPVKAASLHPGGVLTLTIGVLDFAKRNGHEVVIVNTARSGFMHVSLLSQLALGFRRVMEVIGHLYTRQFAGVIIFAGDGPGFYERILMSLICRLFGTKDVFVIVDGNFFRIRQANWFRRNLVRLLLRVPRYITASGRNWDALFDELGVTPPRRIVMHYWLNATFPVASEPKCRPQGRPVRMLYVGWLIREKGVHELLTAINSLRRGYDFAFTFIGGGTLLETVRHTISENGWEGAVEALGWISDEELRKHLTSADVFILPSYAEGFPMSLIEALSFAMPAIVTDVGGVSDSLQDGINGFLIQPRSVESLVTAMGHYLDDPGLIPKHSCAALRVVKKNHDQEVNCRIVFDLFN
jgi:glycosyltransferase involved in cell wall biosynthesis